MTLKSTKTTGLGPPVVSMMQIIEKRVHAIQISLGDHAMVFELDNDDIDAGEFKPSNFTLYEKGTVAGWAQTTTKFTPEFENESEEFAKLKGVLASIETLVNNIPEPIDKKEKDE